uniref:CBS domain-containing protein n=1 Tax=Aegilops tauschii subsp. strangulata TaxID=200361 RepID=A0A452YK63_AEGTS
LSPLVLLPASLSPRPPVEKISPSTPREGFVLETGPGSARECMAVSLLANDVSDLCIGKPAVRSLPLSAAAGDLAATVRKGPRAAAAACIAVGPARGAVVGRAGLADVLCLLCSSPDALGRPAAALDRPVSALLPKDGAGEVRRVDPRSSVLEALDEILSGAQVLAVPLRSGGRKKQLGGVALA